MSGEEFEEFMTQFLPVSAEEVRKYAVCSYAGTHAYISHQVLVRFAEDRQIRIEQKQFLFEYEIRNILYIEYFGKRNLIHAIQSGGSEVTDQVSGHSLSRLLNMAPQNRLLSLLFVRVCLFTRLELGDNETEMVNVVLPVIHIFMFFFLFPAVLLLNSLWFQKSEGHTFFGTAAVFALYLLLLTLFQFDLSAMFRYLPAVTGAWLLVLCDDIAILPRQHRVQTQRRTAMLEQHFLLVEELIEQVRARQHDFSNQMMAVAATVFTAQDLQEAVASLLQNIRLDGQRKAKPDMVMACIMCARLWSGMKERLLMATSS